MFPAQQTNFLPFSYKMGYKEIGILIFKFLLVGSIYFFMWSVRSVSVNMNDMMLPLLLLATIIFGVGFAGSFLQLPIVVTFDKEGIRCKIKEKQRFYPWELISQYRFIIQTISGRINYLEIIVNGDKITIPYYARQYQTIKKIVTQCA